MAKPEKNADAEDQEGAPEGEAQTEGAKKGFIKKLLGNKKLLMIAGGGLLLLLIGAGAGLSAAAGIDYTDTVTFARVSQALAASSACSRTFTRRPGSCVAWKKARCVAARFLAA